MRLTEPTDLRSGQPCWPQPGVIGADPLPDRCEIVVVGAGIMGAMLADRLSREGHQVVVLDRRPPAHGSTAASTALVQWAADTPLLHLSQRWGAERAAAIWKRLHRTVNDLAVEIEHSGIDCGWQARSELYLAGNLLDEDALKAEAECRAAAGLPSVFLEAGEVKARFDLPARAALLSQDAFGVDPVALTHGLLERARAAGAAIVHPIEVLGLDQADDGVSLILDGGTRLEASHVVLATGYEASRWFLPEAFTLGSSFAIATAPDTPPVWAEGVMLWEASDPYLYARRTDDGRILVGGGDIESADPHRRDAQLAQKQARLKVDGARLLGVDELQVDCAWAATFGSSPDGLPALGQAAHTQRVWLAHGFGGNGVTFARLGAELLSSALAGRPDEELMLFDPYRFEG